MLKAYWVAPAVSVFIVASVQGAVVHLHGGDRISGVIEKVEPDGIAILTRWGVVVEIPFAEVLKVEGEDVALPPSGPAAAPPPAAEVVAKPPAAAPASPSPPVKPKKPRAWHGDLLLGADMRFSEKNQQIYTGRLKLTYSRSGLRNSMDYLASYGSSEDVVTANRMDGSSKTDFDLGKRWYVYNLARAGYDEIRKVDLRYELGPGAGYHVIEGERFRVNFELGATYRTEKRADGSGDEIFVARLAEDVIWTVSPRLSFEEKFEYLPEFEDLGTYRFRFEAGAKYRLLENVSMNISVIDQYETRPAQNVEKNDLQVRSSVGVNF